MPGSHARHRRRPPRSEPVRRPELEPIFSELAEQWESAGRLVPGRADEEWTILARRSPWPNR